ncbi:hypothetical protein GUJ93_ZPchr0003g17221 [Zizania palustris]|uniref:WRKY transcription factor WRKY51 n=1 Tax=Zizania palustris TaxID=103762 RepID=A0A8J5S6I7_ZIZPA|nr:hypothetical protein GUJ93_ZPchr0003g17221 [Zizania palustris]
MDGVEEANRAAVESSEKLVDILSQSGDPFRLMAAVAETDQAVSRFDKVVTILSNRVGHARARVGKRSSPPVDPSSLMDRPLATSPTPCNGRLHVSSATPEPPSPATARPRSQEKEAEARITPAMVDRNMFLETLLFDLNSCSAPSVVSAKNSSKLDGAPMANSSSSAAHIQFQQQKKGFKFEQKPSDKFHIEMPRSGAKEVINFSFDNSVCTSSATTSFFTSISSQLISMSDATGVKSAAAAATPKKPCARKVEDGAGGKCHCTKKKKPREKKVVRVPAISDKAADIPADNYSWRKYGQKPIKGSPHPRGYYRCSSKKDCPARKHVERCRSDPAMLVVTYENEHNHAQPLDLSVVQASNPQA